MKYISTRNNAEGVSASEAIVKGMVPQGGLYVPDEIPVVSEETMRGMVNLSYQELAKQILALYLEEFPAEEIDEMVNVTATALMMQKWHLL